MISPSEINLSTLPSVPLKDRSQLPQSSGIYFAIDSLGTVQYIGRTNNLNQRWTQHHRHYQLSEIGLVRIAYLTADIDLLPSIEAALIQWFNPVLNGSDIKASPGSKIRISVCVDSKTKNDLDRLAKIRKRSLSNLIEVLLEQAVEEAIKNGELKND